TGCYAGASAPAGRPADPGLPAGATPTDLQQKGTPMYVPVISVGDNLPLRIFRPIGGGDFGYAVEYVHTSTQEQVAVRYSVTVTGDRQQEPRMDASVGLLDLRAPITGWVELVNPSTIVQQLAPVFLETRTSMLFA